MRPEKDTGSVEHGALSRRAFLKALGLAAAATGGGALLAGCTTQPQAAAPPAPVAQATPVPAPRSKIVVKMAHVLAATEPITKAWEDAAVRIGERTAGEVEVQVFPASQLGGDRDVAEQSRLGANIIPFTSFGYVAEYVKDFNAVGLPFLFSDWETEGKRIFVSPLMEEMADKYLRQGGMVLLATNYFFGERHIASSRPINTPDDMRGLKIRIPPIDMWRELFVTALGAAGTPLEWAEVYSALQTGVIDAAEAPFSSIKGSKLNEVAKNISVTGHFTQVNSVQVGYKFWDTLPKDVQTIIKEEVVKAGDEYSRAQIESAKRDREALIKEGANLIDVDRKLFREKTKVVYDKFEPTFSKDLLNRIYELRGS
jgi:TRAP-type transport system periplasmic protein